METRLGKECRPNDSACGIRCVPKVGQSQPPSKTSCVPVSTPQGNALIVTHKLNMDNYARSRAIPPQAVLGPAFTPGSGENTLHTKVRPVQSPSAFQDGTSSGIFIGVTGSFTHFRFFCKINRL